MSLMFNKKNYIRAASAGVLIISIFAAGLLTGCEANKNQGNSNVVNAQTSDNSEEINKSESEKTVNDPAANDSKVMEDFQALLANNASLPELIRFIDNNISAVSKENATLMVDKLEEMQKKFLPGMDKKFYKDEDLQGKMSEAFMEDFDISKIYDVEDTELKQLLSETKDSGYKVETAEGMFFPVIDYEFYKKYSSYVTPDMKEYIDIMAVESNNVPAKDAALVIGWNEVLKRAINQEKLISKYSDSIKIADVKELYKKYVIFTLFGLNNTPLFSYETKVIDPKAKEAYLSILESGEESGYIKIISDFVDLLEKNDYKLTDEVSKFRDGIIENMN
ncbi:MAG TPA: hypothetical protein GXX36_05835 [Clostridiaceae bacterium]|nr:hypothetical protein [Clostridiaceae bacterium]HHV99079.1 hypothetical protein [Clostridiaceae bacterium]